MNTYKVTPANQETYTQCHVKELNANVATGTFPSLSGIQLADLYTCPNSCDVLVFHGSCAPVNSTLVETVRINLVNPPFNYIVVLPYAETSRIFTASKTTKQEGFVGRKGIVYYESQAHNMDKVEAELIVASQIISGNKEAFIRELK